MFGFVGIDDFGIDGFGMDHSFDDFADAASV